MYLLQVLGEKWYISILPWAELILFTVNISLKNVLNPCHYKENKNIQSYLYMYGAEWQSFNETTTKWNTFQKHI